MVSLNRVIIAGNLTRDPELKTTPNNKSFTNMTVAIDEYRKGPNGKKTAFVNVIAWGALAENCAKYLKKGKCIMVEGRISTDQYTDKQGKMQYITRITSSSIVFMDPNVKKNQIEIEPSQTFETPAIM